LSIGDVGFELIGFVAPLFQASLLQDVLGQSAEAHARTAKTERSLKGHTFIDTNAAIANRIVFGELFLVRCDAVFQLFHFLFLRQNLRLNIGSGWLL